MTLRHSHEEPNFEKWRDTLPARVNFSLGRIVATPGVLAMAESNRVNLADYLRRHHAGDWGDMGADDKARNDEALADGSRIFSGYETPGGKIWIITEAKDDDGNRKSTCILLPDEY